MHCECHQFFAQCKHNVSVNVHDNDIYDCEICRNFSLLSFGAEAEEDEEEVDIATEVNLGVVMALNCSCYYMYLEKHQEPVMKIKYFKKKFIIVLDEQEEYVLSSYLLWQ